MEALAARGDPLAIAQIEAWDRFNNPTPDPVRGVGLSLPPSAVAASARAAELEREWTKNPKIHQADVDGFKPLGKLRAAAWRRAAGLACNRRQVGDQWPTSSRIWAVADVLERSARNADGHVSKRVQMSLAEIGHLARCCVDTAFLAVRYLDRAGLIDTFNSIVRQNGRVERGPNVYLLWLPDSDPAEREAAASARAEAVEVQVEVPAEVDPEADWLARWVARFNRKLERWAPAFGLVARSWGLNATPMSPAGMARQAAHARERDGP